MREIKKRIPVDLTVPEWHQLQRDFPGQSLASIMRQAYDIGIAQLRAQKKESV